MQQKRQLVQERPAGLHYYYYSIKRRPRHNNKVEKCKRPGRQTLSNLFNRKLARLHIRERSGSVNRMQIFRRAASFEVILFLAGVEIFTHKIIARR